MKILKNIAIKRRIQKNLKNKRKIGQFNGLEIQKIGCIVDIEKVNDTNFLKDFIKSYGVHSENFIILGYEEKSENTHIGGTSVFTWKDINYSGIIRNYHADRLSEVQYDILINYFDEPKLPLLLLSSSVKAKFRIGFGSIPENYNDLIIHSKISDKTIFTEEAKKIIKTIK